MPGARNQVECHWFLWRSDHWGQANGPRASTVNDNLLKCLKKKKKSRTVRSGDRSGQSVSAFLEITCAVTEQSRLMIATIHTRTVCENALSRWKFETVCFQRLTLLKFKIMDSKNDFENRDVTLGKSLRLQYEFRFRKTENSTTWNHTPQSDFWTMQRTRIRIFSCSETKLICTLNLEPKF